MKAVKVAGLVLALLAVNAFAANTGQVSFALKSPQAGMTVPMDGVVDWTAAITNCTGNNVGVYGYQFNVELYKDGVLVPVILPKGAWATGYAAGTLKETTGIGNAGAASNQMASNAVPGKLIQYAQSYGPNWPGEGVWKTGIGLAAKKATLLDDGMGDYDLVNNSFDVAGLGLTEGTYTIKLIPGATNILNLFKGTTTNLVLWANTLATPFAAATTNGVQQFDFTVAVPEPTTLILLAGAAAFLRRRRA